MWKQDLQEMLAMWDNSHLIQKIEAAYDGIVVTDTSGKAWKYSHHTKQLTELSSWRHKEA